jgi:hypothetical protein
MIETAAAIDKSKLSPIGNIPPEPEALPEQSTIVDKIPTHKTRWNITELLNTDFPEPTGPIPGIMPSGFTLFGGRPKRGKSWLMLQAAIAKGSGGYFLNSQLTQGRVLYYALEDTPRRLKSRIEKLEIKPDALITFERVIKPLHLEGINDIRREAADFDLIILDTIGRALPGRDFVKDTALIGDVLSRLQEITQVTGTDICGIVHTRKPNGFDRDPIDDILGGIGMTASPDCVLALYKESGKSTTFLQGRARDLDDIDLTLEFDPLTCAWKLIGESAEVKVSDEEGEITAFLQDAGKAKVSTISKELHKDRGNTSRRCASLWTKGILRKEDIEGVTFYYLPTQHTYTTQDTQGTQDTQAV